jgi:hypothetical protein
MSGRLRGDLVIGQDVPRSGCANHVVASSLLILGVAVLLFGVAWGLVTIGLAVPLVVAVCLIVAAVAIRVAVSRVDSDDMAWDPGEHRAIQYDYLRQSYYYRRRRPTRSLRKRRVPGGEGQLGGNNQAGTAPEAGDPSAAGHALNETQ